MHISSLKKMEAFLTKYCDKITGSVLDFGSRDVNGSYRSLFPSPNWKYVGLDLEPGKNVDLVVADPHSWDELADETFELVISGQALEHCEFFWQTFSEIARVLKPSGICCIIAPSAGPEHRYPVDCWRFFPDGMRALCKYTDMICLETFTDSEPGQYEDWSGLWRDTVLVACKKA